MSKALIEKDTKKGLAIVATLIEEGTDIKYFLQQLIEHLHKILLSNINGDGNVATTLEEMKSLFELLTKAYGEMKFAVLSQLPLELAIITWGQNEAQPKQINHTPAAPTKKSIMAEADEDVTVSTLRKQVGTMKKIKALYGTDPQKNDTAEEKPEITTSTVELLKTGGDGPVTEAWLALFWNNLLSEMKKHNHTVAGVLRGCKIKSYTDQTLVIQTAYKFHKERLDDLKNRDALLQISKLLTGKTIDITIELKSN